MPTVTLTTRGLCGYLYNEKQKELIILMVEHTQHAHDPMIVVDLAALHDPDYDDFNIVDTKGWIDLTGCDVRIKPDGNSMAGKLKLHNKGPWKKDCPTSAVDHFVWFPDLNQLSGGKPSRPELSQPSLPTSVLSRVFLTAGLLRCGDHVANKKREVMRFRFAGEQEYGAIGESTTCGIPMRAFTEFDIQRPPGTPWKKFRVEGSAKVVIQHLPRHSLGDVDGHWRAFDQLLKNGKTPKLEEGPLCPELLPRAFPRKPCPQSFLQ